MMKEFAWALTSGQDDSLSCQACEEQLADYVDAEQQGQQHHPQFGRLRRHLQQCPHCAAGYRELRALAELAYGEPLAAPARQPSFDFSFLAAAHNKPAHNKPAVRSFWWDDAGRFVLQLSQELLGSAQPSLQPAHVRVKGQGDTPLVHHVLDVPGGDLRLTISVSAMRDDPAAGTMTVEADIPSRGGWPNLADTQITLWQGDVVLASAWTDEFGKAVFARIPLAVLTDLAVEIAPAI